MKKIGVLTSGGDAPGMNAAIRAVVRAALAKGTEVVGVMNGYNGLIEGEFVPLTLRSVSSIINRGGTMLRTARCEEFKTDEGQNKGVAQCIKEGIEGLVVIGGDGSFQGARKLSLKGIKCVAIPGTIDNDIACSEYTIGYDTAMNTAMEMVDKLRDTMESHQRCSVVEVMGRNAGYIALNTGIACGATSVLIPEIEFDIQKDIVDRLNNNKKLGRKHFIIVVSEGLNITAKLSDAIKEGTGMDTKITILGHVQRGGSPTLKDRLMASKMGYEAVEILWRGEYNRVVAVHNGEVVNYDILEGLEMTKEFPKDDYKMAHTLSI